MISSEMGQRHPVLR